VLGASTRKVCKLGIIAKYDPTRQDGPMAALLSRFEEYRRSGFRVNSSYFDMARVHGRFG